MVLNEEQNEHEQQKWFSRIARGRLDLSVSVEETLEDSVSDEAHWKEEPMGSTNYLRSAQGKTQFPPRLSLQSLPLATFRSECVVESDQGSFTIVPSGDAVERKPTTTTQNTNILVRFAQRLTSSFAALGSTVTNSDAAYFSVEEKQGEESGVVNSKTPFSPHDDFLEQKITVSTEELMMRDVAKTLSPAVPPSIGDSQMGQGKQRLARNTKIRLEAVSIPVTPGTQASQDTSALGERVQRKKEDCALPLPHDGTWTSTHLPTVGVKNNDVPNASVNPSVIDVFKGTIGVASRGALSGSGYFECGQSDTTIANSNVTSSSVVLVTLTANPGPVVVQYISLQPHVGFTVHLTAPTAMRTPFNYIVLLGELF